MLNTMTQVIGRIKKRLGDLLVDAGVLTERQLSEALIKQKEKQQKLGVTLIDMGITTEEQIANALRRQMNLEMVTLSEIIIPEEIIALVDESVLRKYSLIPFAFSQSNPGILRVAMTDPLDIIAVDDISIVTNYQVEPVITTHKDIAAAIDRYYGNAEAMKVAERYTRERQEQYAAKEKDENVQSDEVNNAPIVQLVTKIIEQAVRQRASDIHIEALSKQVRIRYRVDGVLKEVMCYEAELLPTIIARIKIIGGIGYFGEKKTPGRAYYPRCRPKGIRYPCFRPSDSIWRKGCYASGLKRGADYIGVCWLSLVKRTAKQYNVVKYTQMDKRGIIEWKQRENFYLVNCRKIFQSIRKKRLNRDIFVQILLFGYVKVMKITI